MCWWVAQVGGTPHVAPAAPAETPGMRCQSSGSAWDNGVWPFHQDVQKGTARQSGAGGRKELLAHALSDARDRAWA